VEDLRDRHGREDPARCIVCPRGGNNKERPHLLNVDGGNGNRDLDDWFAEPEPSPPRRTQREGENRHLASSGPEQPAR